MPYGLSDADPGQLIGESPMNRAVFGVSVPPTIVPLNQSTSQTLNVALAYGDVVHGLQQAFTEPCTTGSSYVSGANRFLLIGLAMTMRAQTILETGFNTGLTTLAFATTGATVVALDNLCEDSKAAALAKQRLASFPNVTLVQEDALLFLACTPPETYDFIFLDDCHWPLYTFYECIEAQRILRPGGCVVFHDTTQASAGLWQEVKKAFPVQYERINLPSWQGDEGYSGVDAFTGKDFGLGIVRKPVSGTLPSEVSMSRPIDDEHPAEVWSTHGSFPLDVWETGVTFGPFAPGMLTTLSGMHGRHHTILNAEHDRHVPVWLLAVANDRDARELLAGTTKRFVAAMLRCWGVYCSNRASHRARERSKGCA